MSRFQLGSNNPDGDPLPGVDGPTAGFTLRPQGKYFPLAVLCGYSTSAPVVADRLQLVQTGWQADNIEFPWGRMLDFVPLLRSSQGQIALSQGYLRATPLPMTPRDLASAVSYYVELSEAIGFNFIIYGYVTPSES
jgi:hypothetical protein